MWRFLISILRVFLESSMVLLTTLIRELRICGRKEVRSCLYRVCAGFFLCKIEKLSSDFWKTQFPKMGKKLSFWPKTQFKMVKKPSFHPQNSVFSPKTQFKIAKTQFFRNFNGVDGVTSAIPLDKSRSAVSAICVCFVFLLFVLGKVAWWLSWVSWVKQNGRQFFFLLFTL